MDALTHLLQHKIVAIIRGVDELHIADVVEALAQGGVVTVEVTLNSPGALESISKISKTMGKVVLTGAGTVLTADETRSAVAAGARFIISPIVDAGVIETTKQLGVVSIPGAFTATEIVQAYRLGADIVKVFPASGGPGYIKDLRGPLPHIKLMPTGGVQLDNIPGFKKAGAVAYGIGSALVDGKQPITADYLRRITKQARLFTNAVLGED